MLLTFLLLGMAWAPRAGLEAGGSCLVPSGTAPPGRVERWEREPGARAEPINKIS